MLIVVEGFDGLGKTSIIEKAVALLKEDNRYKKRIKRFKSPNFKQDRNEDFKNLKDDTYIRSLPTEQRNIIFKEAFEDFFSLDLEPNLAKRKIIFCDRYVYSNYAYGGDIIEDRIKPDLLIYLRPKKNYIDEFIQSVRDQYPDKTKGQILNFFDYVDCRYAKQFSASQQPYFLVAEENIEKRIQKAVDAILYFIKSKGG